MIKQITKIGLFAWLLLSQQVFAEALPADSLFRKANEAYKKELYQEAVEGYQSLIDSGWSSAGLFYNAGNAYFKTGQIPAAILYYEKALKLKPGDEDIAYNLQVANNMIVDKIEPVPELFYKKWWRGFYQLFPADTWAWLTVIFFWLSLTLGLFFLLAVSRPVRKTVFFGALGFLILFAVSLTMSISKHHYEISHQSAIVFTPTVTVKSSPSPNSVDLFVVHEGTKVGLRDRVGDWYEIKIASGSVGWLPADALKPI